MIEQIAREVQEETDRWDKIRSKNLLGRIRYNRHFKNQKIFLKAIDSWLPKAGTSLFSWTKYIAGFSNE